MRKIFDIFFDGMGTGQKSGMDKATAKLKNKPVGSVAICRFYNGFAMFIKDKKEVRPITDKEVKTLNKEKDEEARKKGNLRFVKYG